MIVFENLNEGDECFYDLIEVRFFLNEVLKDAYYFIFIISIMRYLMNNYLINCCDILISYHNDQMWRFRVFF